MIPHYRRWWLLPTLLLLALPLLVEITVPAARNSGAEARRLAAWPALPASVAGWRALPTELDAYLRDHFGLRRVFIRGYLLISQFMSREGTSKVLVGPRGRLFLRGDSMVPQSAGLLRRDAEVVATADLLAEIKPALAAQGARLLVASPPNSASIYPEDLPAWAINPGVRTEYDVFLDALAAHGVAAVDLRPPLRAAKAQGATYRMVDTHWTPRGALVAFNAIARADGHPDWQLDPRTALGPPGPAPPGDLARMLRFSQEMTEINEPLALPYPERTLFAPPPYIIFLTKPDRPGPTVLVVGDSFTAELFAPMLIQHAGRVAYVYHDFCRFDWKWIEQFRPDEVWWMPTERHIICKPPGRPIGLPAAH